MKCRILMLGLCALQTQGSLAGPADYIHTPTVEYGEKEIDFKDGTRKTVSTVGFGYGATEY